MGHEELKTEITKIIDGIPDAILEDILAVLKNIEAKTKTLSTEEYLNTIFNEDKEVLQKLAQ